MLHAVTPETCRVVLQWINICILLHLLDFYSQRNVSFWWLFSPTIPLNSAPSLINAYWALRATSCMSSRNISCYHISHNFLLTLMGLCSFANRVRTKYHCDGFLFVWVYMSVAVSSSRITRVTTVSVQVGFVVVSVTHRQPPPLQ